MAEVTLSKSGKSKVHNPGSGITQKPATYRIDLDLVERLADVKPNKNIFINSAIREKLDREYPVK